MHGAKRALVSNQQVARRQGKKRVRPHRPLSWAGQHKLRRYPQQLEGFCIFAIKSACAMKIERLCYKKYMLKLSHKNYKNTLEPSRISQSICTRTLRTPTRYLNRNPPEPHQAYSLPKPSGTSSGTSQSICTRAPEPNQVSPYPLQPHRVPAPVSAAETSRTCTGTTLRNLTICIRGICCWGKRQIRNPPAPEAQGA